MQSRNLGTESIGARFQQLEDQNKRIKEKATDKTKKLQKAADEINKKLKNSKYWEERYCGLFCACSLCCCFDKEKDPCFDKKLSDAVESQYSSPPQQTM